MIAKTVRIEIKVTPRQRLAWLSAAEREGLALSEWLRQQAARAIGWDDPSQRRAPDAFRVDDRPAA